MIHTSSSPAEASSQSEVASTAGCVVISVAAVVVTISSASLHAVRIQINNKLSVTRTTDTAFFINMPLQLKKCAAEATHRKTQLRSVATQYNIPKTRAYYNKAYVFTNSKVCFLFVIIKLCRKIYYSKKEWKKQDK